MSASNIIKAASLASQQAVAGETLTFVINSSTQLTITDAVVNRNIVTGRDFGKLLKENPADFGVLGVSTIEVHKDSVTDAPQAGQYFIDGFGYRHRVRYTSQTKSSWISYCTPSATS